MDKKLSFNEVHELLRKHGSKGAGLLSALGKQHVLVRILDTEIGQELVGDAAKRMDRLLLKIINEDASEKDIADYRALKSITEKWALKIDAYFTNLKEVGGK